MEEDERRFLERMLDTLGPSLARNMRETPTDDLVADDDRLTERGRLWVHGYLTGRLSMLRAGATGNPNLSAGDLSEIEDLVDGREAGIAAELYA